MNKLIKNIHARRPWMLNNQTFSYGFTTASDNAPDARDTDIASRLITAYRLATRERHPLERGDDVWARFVETHYGDMISLIERGDARALAIYLTALPRQGAGHGYFQGKVAFDMLMANPARHRERALWLLDHLVALAEAIGVLRVRCPEQGDWDTPPFGSVDELRTRIEREMSLPITLPEIFDGFFVLQPENGPIHLRSIMAAYAIRQIVQLMKHLDQSDPHRIRIAEIGAGIGYSAFAGHKLGIGTYTIYDLPEVNVAQGFFLLKVLGESEVSLFGEARARPISVLPSSAFESAPQEFDVTINIDSLPEIAPEIIDRYLTGVSKRSRYFFSINQEAPLTQSNRTPRRSVLESVASHPELVPLLRYPNWIRAGYVEELFRSEPAAPGTA